MEKLYEILKQYSLSADAGVSLYDCDGQLLFTTGGCCDEHFKFTPVDVTGGAVSDRLEDVTYFSAGGGLVGVIDGSKESDRACACALSLLCRSLTSGGQKEEVSVSEAIKRLLSGRSEYAYAISEGSYFVLCLNVQSDKIQDVQSYLEAVSQSGDVTCITDEAEIIYLKKCQPDGGDYRSAGEFAEVLYDSIKEENRIELAVAVGGAAQSVSDIYGCCESARSTLKLAKALDGGSGVFGCREYSLVSMLEQFPRPSIRHYFDSLAGDEEFKKMLSDGELINTAEAFFKNDLNVSETSRNMYLHRNTLIYRLDKIEKATGLNIRRFNDALTLRVAIILNKLLSAQTR